MKTHQEEKYVHLEFCSADLNSALKVLNEIRKQPDNPLVGAAFQFALMAYARPYSDSFGVLSDEKGKPTRLRLSESCVPEGHKDLHRRIMYTRKKLIAHADLGARGPSLSVVDAPSGRFTATLQSTVYGTEELGNIDAIVDLIQETLLKIYADLVIEESKLPASP